MATKFSIRTNIRMDKGGRRPSADLASWSGEVIHTVMGGLSPQAMNHHTVPFLPHPEPVISGPALTNSHPLRGGSFVIFRWLGLLRPLQPISFLLAHGNSFLEHRPILRL